MLLNSRAPLVVRPSRLVMSVIAVAALAVGCSRPKPAAAPAQSAPERSSPAAAPVPAELIPNLRHDRRPAAGVRSPAKPLVLQPKRTPKCGHLGGLALADAQDLLEGRLKVTLPSIAKGVANPPGSLSTAEESRLVFARRDEAFAVVARELFQLDPDLYESDGLAKPRSLDEEAATFLRQTYGKQLEVSPIALDGGKMRAYAARPRLANAPPGEDTALALAMLVAHPDGTLQSLAFFVRGELVRVATGDALVGCTRLAERIAATVVPGGRALERDAGVRQVGPFAKQAFTVSAPADYVVVSADDRARIYKLRPLSLYPGSISVIVSDKQPDAEINDPDAEVDGKLFGHPIQWRGKTSGKGTYLFAAEPLAGASSRFAAVVLKTTKQPKVLEEFRAVAETLSVVDAPEKR